MRLYFTSFFNSLACISLQVLPNALMFFINTSAAKKPENPAAQWPWNGENIIKIKDSSKKWRSVGLTSKVILIEHLSLISQLSDYYPHEKYFKISLMAKCHISMSSNLQPNVSEFLSNRSTNPSIFNRKIINGREKTRMSHTTRAVNFV